MADLLTDIVAYLVDAGLATEGNIFTDFAPETPDSIIVVYEYESGPVPLHANVAQRSVQISVREKSPALARKKAYNLYNALYSEDKLLYFTADRYALVTLRNTPIKLEVDEADRHYYKFNIGLTTYIEGMV